MTPNYVNSEGCYNGVGDDGEGWGDFVTDRERGQTSDLSMVMRNFERGMKV